MTHQYKKITPPYDFISTLTSSHLSLCVLCTVPVHFNSQDALTRLSVPPPFHSFLCFSEGYSSYNLTLVTCWKWVKAAWWVVSKRLKVAWLLILALRMIVPMPDRSANLDVLAGTISSCPLAMMLNTCPSSFVLLSHCAALFLECADSPASWQLLLVLSPCLLDETSLGPFAALLASLSLT